MRALVSQAVVMLELVGCGNVAATADVPPIDAAVDAGPTLCDPTGTFDPPALLTGFATSANEFAARLSPDELTIYVAANLASSKGGHDLYVAQRSSTQDPFGALMPLTALNSAADEYEPTISADGLTLVFTSNRLTGEGFHLYVSTRTSTLAAFESVASLAGVAAPTLTSNDMEPFLTSDGQELWFASDRASTFDLYRAPRAGSGFGNPAMVGELSTSSGEYYPALSTDRLTVYFARSGTQNIDIWTAHRSTVADGFPPPAPVARLETAADDRPTWLSTDNCRLYLMSTVTGNWDVYVATRHPGALPQ